MSRTTPSVSVAAPDSAAAESIKAAVDNSAVVQIDYNALAEKYNAAQTGSILLVVIPKSYRASNMARVLAGRGLSEGVDFRVSRVTRDEHGNLLPVKDRPLAVFKLTDTNLRVI